MLVSLISLRLLAALTKDMVNLDLTKRALTYAGQQLFHLGAVVLNEGASSVSHHLAKNDLKQQKALASTTHNYKWLNNLFISLQERILWTKPRESIIFFASLNCMVYILVTYFNFFTIICLSIFVYNLIDVWCNHVWPEIRVPVTPEQQALEEEEPIVLDPQLWTLDELSKTASNLIKTSELYLENLFKMRREEPVKFCSIVCGVLSVTAFIGSRICSLSLILLTTSLVTLAPGIYLYLLPLPVKNYLKSIAAVFHIAQEPSSVTEKVETPSITSQIVDTLQKSVSTPSSSKTNECIAQSTSPKSLLDHLKCNSLIATFRRDSVDSAANVELVNEQTQDQSGSRLDHNQTKVPKLISNETGQDNTNVIKDTAEKQDIIKLGDGTAVGSDNLSSTDESTSLVDLDEDQQDGFVML